MSSDSPILRSDGLDFNNMNYEAQFRSLHGNFPELGQTFSALIYKSVCFLCYQVGPQYRRKCSNWIHPPPGLQFGRLGPCSFPGVLRPYQPPGPLAASLSR